VTQKSGSRGGPGESFGLDFPEVKEWLFCPGMVFQATGKWWGDKTGSRPRPHEGLDLLIYRDFQGAIRCLDESTPLPVIYDGVVVGRIPDFLGTGTLFDNTSDTRPVRDAKKDVPRKAR